MNFGDVAENIIRSTDLSPTEKIVAIRLARYQRDNKWAWPYVQQLANETGLKQRNCRYALSALLRKGWIIRHDPARQYATRDPSQYALTSRATAPSAGAGVQNPASRKRVAAGASGGDEEDARFAAFNLEGAGHPDQCKVAKSIYRELGWPVTGPNSLCLRTFMRKFQADRAGAGKPLKGADAGKHFRNRMAAEIKRRAAWRAA